MSARVDAKDLETVIARARAYAASVPEGDDVQRMIAGQLTGACDLIETTLQGLKLLPATDVSSAEWAGRLNAMREQVYALIVQGEALGLARQVGKVRAERSKGGETRAALQAVDAGTNRAKVESAEKSLRAQGVKEHNLNAKIAAKVNLSVKQVSRIREKNKQ